MPLQLADVGNLALGEGLDPEAAMAVMAIAQTEGGLGGAVGDNGQSHSWLQLYSGGQLQNFANDIGVPLGQAAQIADSDPELVGRWALSPRGTYGWKHNGYLGDTLRAGQQQGLHGADLAHYGQRFGQVSVSPERAAQNYASLFGDYSPSLMEAPQQDQPVSADGANYSDSIPRAQRPSQFNLGLDAQTAAAFCGPVAAMTFAAVHGRYPTLEEAKQIAVSNNLWDPQNGMHGPQSMQTYLQDLGVPARFDQAVDWNGVQSRASHGSPTLLSTPGHYFYVDDFDPTAGTYHVGSSGTDLRGGAEWETPDQMTARMGAFNGSIYADDTPQPGGATPWP